MYPIAPFDSLHVIVFLPSSEDIVKSSGVAILDVAVTPVVAYSLYTTVPFSSV